ncbi:MAG: D-alanyl-D-alanine carboxypeptidase [Comamonadaceae bacterium]|nr:D-alanyl-D-alanine carboxypeptidase [Comamonadaceae bacterium]
MKLPASGARHRRPLRRLARQAAGRLLRPDGAGVPRRLSARLRRTAVAPVAARSRPLLRRRVRRAVEQRRRHLEPAGCARARCRPSARRIALHESAPLAEVIRDVNKFSNNVMARQIYLTLGTDGGAPAAPARRAPRRRSAPGSTAAAWPCPNWCWKTAPGCRASSASRRPAWRGCCSHAFASPLMPELMALAAAGRRRRHDARAQRRRRQRAHQDRPAGRRARHRRLRARRQRPPLRGGGDHQPPQCARRPGRARCAARPGCSAMADARRAPAAPPSRLCRVAASAACAASRCRISGGRALRAGRTMTP